MPKPVCVKCQRFYRCKKVGIAFIEGMPFVEGAKPGTEEPDKWKPYKLWQGDRFECEGCGNVILSGFGSMPISEHYRPDFADQVAGYGATLQVNDC